MGKKTKSVNNKQSTGIDFIRAKKKVGRKIRKQANETNTEVRAKRINLSVQSLGTEGKGDQVTGRGLSMPELLNQCQHYSARVRKDALDGIKELLETHPTSLVPCAATCVEKVAERLVDQEHIVRAAARGALRSGVLPALGPHGIAPFAERLVLHVGAALTHVAPAVRRDAPAVLEALLDAAPLLVGAYAPAATLRHLAELLRRGDDAASSSLVSGASDGTVRVVAGGLSAKFGDMTASRVGPQQPQSRLGLLQSCRRFLEVLVGATTAALDFDGVDDGDARFGGSARGGHRWRWGDGDGDDLLDGGPDGKENGRRTARAGNAGGAGVALHAARCARAPVSAARAVETLFGVARGDGGTRMGRRGGASGDGREGVAVAAAELAALLFAVWDEATPTLKDVGGPNLTRVRVMAEAMSCMHLCLWLVDVEGGDRDSGAGGGGGDDGGDVSGAAMAAALPHLVARVLPVFPASAPPVAGDVSVRGALVRLNACTARILSAASEGAAKVAAKTAEDDLSGSPTDLPSAPAHVAPTWRWNHVGFHVGCHVGCHVDVDAADRATCAVADFLSSGLRGCALDAGPCGEAEPTGEGDYGDLLRMARGVLLRPALGSPWGGVDERRTDVEVGETDDEDEENGRMDDEDDTRDGYPTGTDADGSRTALAASVGEVWSEAVVSGPPERRGACVSLLAAVLPRVAATRAGAQSRFRAPTVGADVAAGWLRPYARLLWELKHGDPGTTSRALRTLHAVAARCSGEVGEESADESPLAGALAAVETELAPFFARVPPPSSTDQTAPRPRGKPGPFSKLPSKTQHLAIALLGQLPCLSPTTLRAAAHAALAPDADPNTAVRAAEAVTCNMRAAPLALSVSFLSALLTGAGSWRGARSAAPAAARALVGVGDSDSPWAGAVLAWPAVNLAIVRAERAGDAEGARRARFGVIVLAALASEARRAQREAKEASAAASAPARGESAESAEERVSALDVDAEAAVVAWACDGFATAPGGGSDGDEDLRGASARLARSDPGWARSAFRHLRLSTAPLANRPGGEGSTAGAKRDGASHASRCDAVVYSASAFAALVGDVLPEGTVRELAADSGEIDGDETFLHPLFATMRTCEEAADACVRDELPGSARAARAVRAAKLALDGVVGGLA